MNCRKFFGICTPLQFPEGQRILAGQHCFSVPIGEIFDQSHVIYDFLSQKEDIHKSLPDLSGRLVCWGKIVLAAGPASRTAKLLALLYF